MNLSPLLDLVRSSAAYQELLLALQSAHTPPSLVSLNLLSAARPFLLAALHQDYPQPILLVAPKPEQALVLSRQLVHYNPPTADVLLFPEAECLPYERASMSPGTRQKRIAALHRLTLARQSPRPLILIASVRSLMQQTLAPAHYEQSVHTIQRDGRYPLDALMRQWQQSGYEPVDTVEQPGQFAHRGGILDIWSPAHDIPVRLEFFGDEVDSIRRFDIASQRSREPLDEVTFLPASETLPAFGGLAARRLRALVDNAAHLTDSAQRDFNDDLRALGEGKRFKDLEFYLPYLEQEPACLLDYLGDGALVVSDDWQEVQAQAQSWELEVAQLQQDAVSRGEVPPSFSAPVTSWDGIRFDRLKRLDFTFGLVEDSLGRWEELFHTPPQYSGRMLQAVEDWKSRSENQTQPSARLVVVSRQAERIAELMREQDVQVAVQETVHEGRLSLLQGTLAAGFVFEPTSLLVLSDTEIFGYARPEPRRSSEKRAAPSEAYYADLMAGDYVVHVEHGIARYTGLVRRDFYYGEREYLQLEFAESDRLYVPTYQADRVARYVNSGAHPPAIHRLGSADWETAKSQAKRAIDDLADELMELYAKREQVSGHAFAADSTWQRELEDSFPFAETPDQLRALAAIKHDMESSKPMDRLICGDVGYGKTEVGLRAAFKAVLDGKQVAVLVPTTVLAEQHLKTFQERLRPFPVEVEMLSRFRTKSQQEKILERMKLGGLDIIIGTHRLLQDDVQFRDLGLIIIDEEQRFGVKAKERFKQLRTEVDVLTLTATPIPRTMQMALMGARDMSTIDTPPEERLPIRTVVKQYDESVIKQAILREIGRGGQVFFVHNRVQGIEQIADRIRRLVPDARVVCGHGQMRERELERVMLDFGDGKYDVLVCTAIIESGIDLPNVNTIIVNRADQFGLADLYQLRGRVGRSARQAYAYLLYSRDKVLVDIVRRRLQAIFEASDLGAGFKIAMRDLEIRGAGDILGARQHGHIASIGFDLYTKLLAQAVRARQQSAGGDQRVDSQETPDVDATVTIDLPLEAHLPKDYVPDADLRLRLYRRMAGLNTVEAVEELRQELADRFGPLPEPVLNILHLLRLKALALRAGIDSITAETERIVLHARERRVLIGWRPPSDLERGVTVGRITLTLDIEENGGQGSQASLLALERLLAALSA